MEYDAFESKSRARRALWGVAKSLSSSSNVWIRLLHRDFVLQPSVEHFGFK